jgi:hypothetical protein
VRLEAVLYEEALGGDGLAHRGGAHERCHSGQAEHGQAAAAEHPVLALEALQAGEEVHLVLHRGTPSGLKLSG